MALDEMTRQQTLRAAAEMAHRWAMVEEATARHLYLHPAEAAHAQKRADVLREFFAYLCASADGDREGIIAAQRPELRAMTAADDHAEIEVQFWAAIGAAESGFAP